MVKAPPASCPEGILMPVVASLLSCSGYVVPPIMAQLATLPQEFVPDNVVLLGASLRRICWYVPAGIPAVPSVARKHPLVGMLSRSTCTGALFKLGVRSTHPASLLPAFALVWIETSVMVT